MEIDRLRKRGIFRVALFFLAIAVALGNSGALATIATAEAANSSVEIWWPTTGTTLSGTSPVKGILSGYNISDYTMTWNVDNGKETPMDNSQAEYPHKEGTIDFTSWNWKGAGPYTITLIARGTSGTELARNSVQVYTNGNSSTTNSTPTTTQATQQTVSTPTVSTKNISVWWPTNNTHVTGTTPLKAVVDDTAADTYKMYWQVDNREKTEMPTNTADWPHKEISVDTALWNWNSTNQYTITFTATDNGGTTIATKNIAVISDNAKTITSVNTSVTDATTQIAQAVSGKNPLSGQAFFTGTYSPAASQVESWKYSRPADAELIKKLVGVQDARWFGEWNSNISADVNTYVSAAASAGTTPVMVAYNIPFRDCGGYSSGGASSATNYKNWIQSFANGIGSKKAVVIVEPDALAGMDCLSASDQSTRLNLLSYAVTTLKKNTGTVVYLDAGHSNWHPAADTAARLQKANIALADGFSLNVSNYYATPEVQTFGNAVSAALGGKHYIVDTSRNGNGSNGEWCNATGRALGNYPTTSTGNSLVDAYLWIKKPGESDGYCNGGPAAGAWWGDYALALVKNSTR